MVLITNEYKYVVCFYQHKETQGVNSAEAISKMIALIGGAK